MRKVLVILDSEDFRFALRDALRDRYEVIDCCDGQTGMTLIRELPDALVLDLLMPGMDGLTFLQTTHDCQPSVILMLTTLISSDILQLASQLGVGHIIRKPCPISAVVNHLTECLE